MFQPDFQGIRIHREYEPDLPSIPGDGNQLKQVFTSLLTNARDAMPQGGRITIRASRNEEYLKVKVEDTGCGIPRENIGKLFDPFFTTKEGSKGTGLGLSVLHGIVGVHGGNVQVESEVGRGSTFQINLPLRNNFRASHRDYTDETAD